MFDLTMDFGRTLFMGAILIGLIACGRKHDLHQQPGWRLLLAGFGFLLLGGLLGIIDNFWMPDRLVAFGHGDFGVRLEEVVVYSLGFLLLSLGIWHWVPALGAMKQAKQALMASEAKLSGILDISSEAVISIDRAHRIRLFNQGAETIFGYSAEEMLGQPLDKLLPARIRPVHDQIIEDFARSPETSRPMDRRGKVIGLRKDGTEFPAEASVSKFEIDGDTILTVTLRDITARSRAEELLRKSNQQFRDLVEGSIQAVLVHLDDEILFANQAAADMFGFDGPDEIVALPSIRLLEAEHERQRLQAYTAARLQGFNAGPTRYEFEGLRKDGASIWLEIFVQPVDWQDRRAVQSTLVDATERKRAERALGESERQFRNVLDNLPAAVFLKDLEGRFRLINKRFETWYGVSPAEVLGKTSHEFYPKAYADAYVAQDREVLATSKVAAREHEVPFADGSDHVVIVTKFPMMNDEGEAQGVVTINTDITELKQSEAALLAAKEEAEFANRVKSEFLANIGHELRTPLNAIIGFSEMIQCQSLGEVGDVRYIEFATDITDAGRHLLSLINEILDISKIEAGEAVLREGVVDLPGVFGLCAKLVAERAQRAGVSVEIDLADGLMPVTADEIKLKQIIINLLSNAVKFTPSGGGVTIKAASTRETGCSIQVIDTGIGIAPEDIPAALMPFRQVQNGLNRCYEGTGLGLPLAKQLIELHGGSLEIQSVVGQGTTMTIWLPPERVMCRSARHRPASSTAAAGTKLEDIIGRRSETVSG